MAGLYHRKYAILRNGTELGRPTIRRADLTFASLCVNEHASARTYRAYSAFPAGAGIGTLLCWVGAAGKTKNLNNRNSIAATIRIAIACTY